MRINASNNQARRARLSTPKAGASLAAAESATVLFVTLVTSGLIGTGLIAFLSLANHQNQATYRSQSWNAALPIVEAGIEEALTHLYHNRTNRAANGWQFINGQYTRSRQCGEGSYRVSIDSNTQPFVVCQGFVRAPFQSEHTITRTVRVQTTNEPLFSGAVQVRETVNLNGNNVRIDSFDSTDPNYSLADGSYDPSRFKDGGNLVSYSGLTNSVNIGNANIYGKVVTGPGGSLKIGPLGTVGSTEWHNARTGVEPGWTSDTMAVNFPEVTAPTGGLPPLGATIDGTNYQYVLGTGTYQVSQLDGSMLVIGHAVLVVNDLLQITGQDVIRIAAGASLELYVKCADALIAGNAIMNDNTTAGTFRYYGLSTNKKFNLNGGASFRGLIYAPDADMTLDGGGSDEIDFAGALVAKSLVMNGQINMHYDEASRAGLSKRLVIASWDEL